MSWMSALANLGEEIIALDGKTIRRSLDRADGKGPMHIVSAWASSNEIVLAQLKVDDKSNEITALPTLLAMLNLRILGHSPPPLEVEALWRVQLGSRGGLGFAHQPPHCPSIA